MNGERAPDSSLEDRLKPWLKRWVDPMVDGRADSRIAVAILGLATLVSLVYCLWVTRGTTFSGDELTWVAFSPATDFKVALEPHSGHLVLVSHLLYKLVLETIGSDYLTFRLLTLFSVYLSVTFLFVYARRRVGPWIALAPCLVLLFFGSDTGHILQGNGFTIMFAIACGMLALLALERDSTSGDIVACLALCLGVVTYTVALPFVVGAGVAILFSDRRWRRMWVVVIPALIYLAWRVWIVVEGIEVARGGLRLEYIALLPAWTFQSLSGVLNALSGLHYNFGGGGWLPPGEMAGPTLALIFVVAVGWRIARGGLPSWFWVAITIATAMLASQVLSWIPDVREPGTSRYLYPLAFVVLLIGFEAVRGIRISRSAFISIWTVALIGLLTNAAIIGNSGNSLRERAPGIKLESTAASLVNEASPFLPGPAAVPLVELVSEPGISLIGPAEREYGGLALTPEQITAASAEDRARIDSIMAQAIGFVLVPLDDPDLRGCRTIRGSGGSTTLPLPEAGAVLRSRTGGAVTIRRFGDDFVNIVGELSPGEPAALNVPPDSNPTPWQVSVAAPAVASCDLP